MAKSLLNTQEIQALLIMFGKSWNKKYHSLDGKDGRPNIQDCVSLAVRTKQAQRKEDIIDFIEQYLENIARRCQTPQSQA